MVASRGEVLRHAFEHVRVVVTNRRGLAVHQAVGADDFAAEVVADRLVPEADAEDGLFSGKRVDDAKRHTRFARRTRANGESF